MASNFQPSLSENGNKATVFQQLCLPVGVTLLVSGTRTLFPYAGCIAWESHPPRYVSEMVQHGHH